MAITAMEPRTEMREAPQPPYFRRTAPVLGMLTYTATNANTGVEYTDFAVQVYDDQATTGNVFVQFRQMSANPTKTAVGKFTADTLKELIDDLTAVHAVLAASSDAEQPADSPDESVEL